MSLKLKYNISCYDELGLNFWGIPKNGNTAVKLALLQKIGKIEKKQVHPNDIGVEYHKEHLIPYIDPNTAIKNGNLNFTVIRHPYERVLSLYKDFGLRRKQSSIQQHKELDDFISYIESTNDSSDIHLRSQSYFICNDKGEIQPSVVCNLINIHQFLYTRSIDLQIINKTTPIDITLNQKQKQAIQNRYKKDFEWLGFNL